MRLHVVDAERIASAPHRANPSGLKYPPYARPSSMNQRLSSRAFAGSSSRAARDSPSAVFTDIPARRAILLMGVLSGTNITNTFLTPHILARRSSFSINLVPIF
jgi:hypothetical protein